MNWKNFCGKLADAGDVLGLHPDLSGPAQSMDRRSLSFLSDVFGIRQDRNRQTWLRARLLADNQADPPMSSLAPRRSRSGTLI